MLTLLMEITKSQLRKLWAQDFVYFRLHFRPGSCEKKKQKQKTTPATVET